MNSVASYRLELNSLKALHKQQQHTFAKLSNEVDVLVKEVEELYQTQDLLKELLNKLVEKNIAPFQDFITYALRTVFPGRDMTFLIQRKETASGTAYNFLLKEGEVEAPVVGNFGYSVTQIVSFMLRLVVIKKLNKAPVLFLDEFFTGISSVRKPYLFELLKTLVKDSGFKILLITHIDEFLSEADLVLKAVATEKGLKIIPHEKGV